MTTVDLTAQAAGAPAGVAPEMSLQQPVFTVQGAARSTLPVRLLMDGKPAQRVLGGVAVTAPVPRGDAYAPRSLVHISEGQVFAPFTFTVTLAPGEYELRISEDDLSDGAGRPVPA